MSDELAAVERFDLSDDLLPPLDFVGQAMQQHAAFVRQEFRPAGEGVGRRLDGMVHVVPLHGKDFGQDFPAAGIDSSERVFFRGNSTFAADDAAKRTRS